MNNRKLLEAIADIAYVAGTKGYFSGDSRADIAQFIHWANEFEKMHLDTDWDDMDYILAIEKCIESCLLLSEKTNQASV